MRARNAMAFVLGYGVFAGSAVALFQITGIDPHGTSSNLFRWLSLGYGAVFAVAAGTLSVRLASPKARWPAYAVTAVMAVSALVSILARPGEGAIWTQLATLLLFAPLCLVASLRAFRRRHPNVERGP